jgi:hypothetical protein
MKSDSNKGLSIVAGLCLVTAFYLCGADISVVGGVCLIAVAVAILALTNRTRG